MGGQERDALHGCVDDGIDNFEGLPGDQITAAPGRPSASQGQYNGATWSLIGDAADGRLCRMLSLTVVSTAVAMM